MRAACQLSQRVAHPLPLQRAPKPTCVPSLRALPCGCQSNMLALGTICFEHASSRETHPVIIVLIHFSKASHRATCTTRRGDFTLTRSVYGMWCVCVANAHTPHAIASRVLYSN